MFLLVYGSKEHSALVFPKLSKHEILQKYSTRVLLGIFDISYLNNSTNLIFLIRLDSIFVAIFKRFMFIQNAITFCTPPGSYGPEVVQTASKLSRKLSIVKT